jgi:hypothetical protein
VKNLIYKILICGNVCIVNPVQALAEYEKTFELSNTEDEGGGWFAPRRVAPSKNIADGIFPISFLNSPVGQMVNSSKNPNLKIGEQLHNYAEVISKLCPADSPNNERSTNCYTIPQTLESAVKLGQDAPINLIQDLHSKSYNFWFNFSVPAQAPHVQALIEDRRAYAILDVNSIKELNLRAAKIWNDLVQCNNKNPEKARLSFFYSRNEQLCSNGNGAVLMKAVMELGFNFQQFVKDTMPLTKLKAYLENREARLIFRNPHPLLTQFALLNWSVFYNHIFEDKMKVSPNISAAMFQFSAYEEDIQRNELFGKTAGLPALLRPMQEDAKILFKVIVNNLIYLSFIEYDELKYSCARYGLWPALNRTILYTQLIHFYSGSIFTELKYLDESATRNCGEKVDFYQSPDWSGVYGRYYQSNLTNMRYQYIDYIGKQFIND